MVNTNKAESLFWKKKEYTSFILSILVFFIHSFFAQDSGDNSLIAIINHKTSYFFSRSITQFAVPMFFMLSGITFFKGYSNKKYLHKIKSRLFTLIIPYLLWNTVWMFWEIFCSYSFMEKFSQADSTFPLTATSILKSIFFYGCNRPFWFIFDLIVFCFAAPLIFTFIRNKYVGIISVLCLSIMSYFGLHLPSFLFYYPTSIIFFMLGAVIGHHYFDYICQKSSRVTQIISITLLLSYVIAKNVIPHNLFIENYLMQVIVFTICCFALWNTLDIFIEKLKPRPIYRRSFAIYAMHLNTA